MAGELHKEFKTKEYTRFTGVPEDALYGLRDYVTLQWTGNWFFDEYDAQEDADGIARSGLGIGVCRVGDDPELDESWLEPSGF